MGWKVGWLRLAVWALGSDEEGTGVERESKRACAGVGMCVGRRTVWIYR